MISLLTRARMSDFVAPSHCRSLWIEQDRIVIKEQYSQMSHSGIKNSIKLKLIKLKSLSLVMLSIFAFQGALAGPKSWKSWAPQNKYNTLEEPLLGDSGEDKFELNTDCPEGYVLVPGNPDYATPTSGKDFCAMKYEASREGNTAKSKLGALPWVNITREAALAACAKNGRGFHLITNSEWMTIARNIEATPENWSGGAVGVGQLSRGNSDSHAALTASSDDDFYSGKNHNDWTHKRTHRLSNREEIWDMAGNVWE